MPGVRCCVPACGNCYFKTRIYPSPIVYHCFPKDKELCIKWVKILQLHPSRRSDNFRRIRVCSDHFTDADYDRDLRAELLNIPSRKTLKNTAVPSLKLGASNGERNNPGNSRLCAKGEGKCRRKQNINEIIEEYEALDKFTFEERLKVALSMQNKTAMPKRELDTNDESSVTQASFNDKLSQNSADEVGVTRESMDHKLSRKSEDEEHDDDRMFASKPSQYESRDRFELPPLTLEQQLTGSSFEEEQKGLLDALYSSTDKHDDEMLTAKQLSQKELQEVSSLLNVSQNILAKMTTKVQSLEKELQLQRLETYNLKREVRRLKSKNLKVEKRHLHLQTQLKKTFTEPQIKFMMHNNKQHVHWDTKSISLALGLYRADRGVYHYLRNELHYPLPSLTTIQRWTSKQKVEGVTTSDELPQ